MPEQPHDDALVPPIKVMHKRLNGVYSAEGFAGPTRRYVLIVAMLVGLASLPTLAAITAGSNELEDGRTGAMDVPFLPPASTGPVRVAPSASAGPGTPVPPVAAGSLPGSGTVRGQAQRRKTKPQPAATSSRRYGHSTRAGSSSGSAPSGHEWESWDPGSSSGSGSGSSPGAGSSPDSGGSGSTPGKPTDPHQPPADPGLPGRPSVPGDSHDDSPDGGSSDDSPGDSHDDSPDGGSSDDSPGGSPGGSPDGDWRDGGSSGGDSSHEPSDDSPDDSADDPSDGDDQPEEPPAKPVHPPWCMDRGAYSSRPSHHRRPDRSRHKHCDDSTHRAHWSHHREGRGRTITVHIEATGRHGPKSTITSPGSVTGRGRAEQSQRIVSIRAAKPTRSDSSRRSEVTERPHNLRPARGADRTHNSHRHQPSRPDRGEGTQTATATRAYRGSHRAEHMHRADDRTGAYHRSSRVGRHHVDQPQDHRHRW